MIRIRLPELIAARAFSEGRRIELGEIADKTGIHRSTLSRMLHTRGYNLTMSNLDRLCRHFRCKVEDVIVYVPDEEVEGTLSQTFKGPVAKPASATTRKPAKASGSKKRKA